MTGSMLISVFLIKAAFEAFLKIFHAKYASNNTVYLAGFLKKKIFQCPLTVVFSPRNRYRAVSCLKRKDKLRILMGVNRWN